MSRRPPPAAPAASNANAKHAELASVIKNFPNLLQAERSGKLSASQIQNLRGLIFGNAKTIVAVRFNNRLPHPLRNLSDNMNPTKPWNNQKPLGTEAQFELAISSAESELVAKNGAKLVALVEASAKGSAAALGNRPIPVSASAAASPSNTGGASTGGANTPAPLAPSAASSSTAAAASTFVLQESGLTDSSGANPAKLDVFSAQEMKQFVDMDKTRREALLTELPQGREKFNRSVQFWTEGGKSLSTAGAQTTNRPTVAPRPSLTGQSLLPGAVGLGYANRPGSQQLQIPEELMEIRRKRKFTEYLSEILPGMEVEIGVNEILEEVMDNFVLENAKGALRLAKHRKSDKVELKDVAFYLDKTHKIRVPGFDAQLAEKVRLPPEEKKVRVTRASAAAAKKAGKDE